ncbi:MAG: hypothetical protein ACI4F4_06965 [Lachnospiraceae bacterium]
MKKHFKKGTLFYRRIIAIILVLLMLLSLRASQSFASPTFLAENPINPESTKTQIYTSQNNFGGTTYTSLAFDFHIFAEEVELNAHTNGNIASNVLKANEQAFGADEQNHLHKREDNYIGTFASGISNIASNGNTIIGNSIETQINRQDKRLKIGQSQNYLDHSTSTKIYKETSDSVKYIDIGKELAYLSTLSTNLSQKSTSADVAVSPSINNTHNIQVTNSGGNHYLYINAKEFFNQGQKTTLNITLPKKTTLIVNVDMNGASYDILKNIVVNLNNHTNGEAIAPNYCGLLWNLCDSGNSNSQFYSNSYIPVALSDYFFGTILAPNANITYGAVNGSIIARKTKQGGRESHRFDFTGYEDPFDEPTTEASTDEPTTEITTETTTEVPSTEITTETTTEVPSTEITTETTTEVPSTEITTETTTEVPSTEITTETTTEVPSTEITTEATTEVPSTEITTETTTEVPSTEITTETTTEVPSTEITTEATTEVPSTEITTETTTEIPTTEITTEATTEIPSTEITTEITATSTTETTQITTQSTTERPPRYHIRTEDDTKVFLLVTISVAALGLLISLIIYKYNQKK